MDRRTFLHVDMDAFFASVEQLDQPDLKGKPVVVGARPDQRGVVAAASYEARKYGIHSAMPSVEAGRRCPHAVFLPVRMSRYQEVSDQVFAVFQTFTPLVEPLSIDEAFLDVTGATGLFGSGPEIARKVREAVAARTGLTASVGVAPNKFLAKLASDMNKPDGVTVVPFTAPGILTFLAPLPVGRIWGVGAVTAQALTRIGIVTVGDLQNMPEKALAVHLGASRAEHLKRLARGEDAREIEMDRAIKSVSKEYTFPKDCRSRAAVEAVLLDLVDDVGTRLRAESKYAQVARIKLRWQGFQTITRQRPLEPACCDDYTLRDTALALVRAEPLRSAVRLVGFGVSHLVDARSAEQLSLFDGPRQRSDKRERLSSTVDDIRARFGPDSIGRAKGDTATGSKPSSRA